MTPREMHAEVLREAREDIHDEEIDEAILVLESSLRSPDSTANSSPDS